MRDVRFDRSFLEIFSPSSVRSSQFPARNRGRLACLQIKHSSARAREKKWEREGGRRAGRKRESRELHKNVPLRSGPCGTLSSCPYSFFFLRRNVSYLYYRLITRTIAVARFRPGFKSWNLCERSATPLSSPQRGSLPRASGASSAEMQFWRQFNLSHRSKRKLWANVYCENRYSRSKSFRIPLSRVLRRKCLIRMAA